MIIDSHSHFGEDYYCGNIKLEDYIDYCKKIGIDISFLMPTPWPQYINNYGNKVTSLIWEHENYIKKNYYSVSENKKEQVFCNPYKEVNEQYYKLLLSYTDINLEYIPLVHGVLDTPEYLDKLFSEIKPIAIKMHGFGSGFSPDKINSDIIEVIKKYDLPIIIHTSVYNYDYGYGADTKYWRNECHPMKWIKFLNEYNLKGVLNHGACLNEESILEVNKNDNLMIGTGPDLDISRDYFKVDIEKERYKKIGYLKMLKEKVLVNKLLFDVDFNWNTDGNDLDYNQIDRFSKIWNQKELDLILSKNAIDFFKLGKPKIKEKK